MKREIKFRAWIPNLGIMLYGITPYADGMIGIGYDEMLDAIKVKNDKWDLLDEGVYLCDEDHFDLIQSLLPGEDWFWVEADNCERLQFTGLHDKNGKEIYEGDIVQHGYKIHTGTFIYTGYVHYATDKAMFYITQLGKEQFNDCAITHNNINGKGKIFEVIGNIYENPELLKV